MGDVSTRVGAGSGKIQGGLRAGLSRGSWNQIREGAKGRYAGVEEGLVRFRDPRAGEGRDREGEGPQWEGGFPGLHDPGQ